MKKIGVIGVGSTGRQVVEVLTERPDVEVLIFDTDRHRQEELLGEFGGSNVRAGVVKTAEASVVVLASPAGSHVEYAKGLLARGSSVVSLSDSPNDVDGLLKLDDQAHKAIRAVVVGAGFAPGLSCLLARFAGESLDVVEEIAIAKGGTGGPACARQHHAALKHDGRDWIDQSWVSRRGGSGRDLAWFPEEIGARDCYRGALPSPTLLQRKYPEASRISARVSATRRDRITSRLPMLRPPHRDGGPGAIRVEVRGLASGEYRTCVYGSVGNPSRVAGLVGALSALSVADGVFGSGAYGLSEIDDPATLLRGLHELGVRTSTFGSSGSDT